MIVVACALLLSNAASSLGGAIDSRYALEVPGGGRDLAAITAQMRAMEDLTAVEPVSDAEMRETLERWLGPAAQSGDLPVPALVNFDIRPNADRAAVERALRAIAPNARLVAHGTALAPLHSSLSLLQWVAIALALLLSGAATAAVVLAARGSMDTHRATIDVLHGIGATDLQVTRLFQRRVAIDSLIGALAGAFAAGAVMLAVASGARWADEMGGLALGVGDFVILALLPLLLSLVTTVVARAAILSALRQQL